MWLKDCGCLDLGIVVDSDVGGGIMWPKLLQFAFAPRHLPALCVFYRTILHCQISNRWGNPTRNNIEHEKNYRIE